MKKVADIGCTSCHSGVLFTNNDFVAFKYGKDAGLKSVTGKDEDDHVFRVQSWRNVAMTAPYFHDGSAATLQEAVKIVAFLETLTGELPTVTLPQLPRPQGHALDWKE